MFRNAVLTIHLLSVSLAAPVLAQRGDTPRGGNQLPTVGTMLPVVTAIDEQGERFSTATLRGSYTVLVFGCLT